MHLKSLCYGGDIPAVGMFALDPFLMFVFQNTLTDQLVVDIEVANRMALFYAHPMPMLNAVIESTGQHVLQVFIKLFLQNIYCYNEVFCPPVWDESALCLNGAI